MDILIDCSGSRIIEKILYHVFSLQTPLIIVLNSSYTVLNSRYAFCYSVILPQEKMSVWGQTKLFNQKGI